MIIRINIRQEQLRRLVQLIFLRKYREENAKDGTDEACETAGVTTYARVDDSNEDEIYTALKLIHFRE